MSKAFKKESDDDAEPDSAKSAPALTKNYVTPKGYADLQHELRYLLKDERPKLVEVVRWAASNGDRSENGDYIYGKRRLREIDRRMRYLTKRIENAEIVHPKDQQNLTRVYFGATVTYKHKDGTNIKVKIVGVDEADIAVQKVSWMSPVAKALMKSEVGDVITLRLPDGNDDLEVLAISYELNE